MYFKGEQQSEEFARGAWAIVDLLTAKRAGPALTAEQLTIEYAGKFFANIAKGGDFARGFVTSVAEIVAFPQASGTPNLDVWRPLEMDLRYTSRSTHPTAGSKLCELDGAAVSVAPDLTVYVWHDRDENDIERNAAFLARVQKRGRPISQREFTAMRKKPKGAKKAQAPRPPAASREAEVANG
jgi:hypothetical protein